jgi:DNA-binding GntR family transcriptional regulator
LAQDVKSASRIAALAAANDAPALSKSGVLALCQDWSPDLQKARVYEQILLDIILGELPPNARLDEQGLVRRYNAGLAGVRDALGRLALEGLVVRRPRAGTTVSPLDLVELSQAMDVRRLLEPYCAALAAANATASDIERVVHAFDGGEAAVRARDCRALVAMDQQFHSAMAGASRNVTLTRILIPLQHKSARYWVYTMGADTEAERLAEIKRHRVLADRIADGDEEGARLTAMRILKIFPGAIRAAHR